jgi:hypothetical protein
MRQSFGGHATKELISLSQRKTFRTTAVFVYYFRRYWSFDSYQALPALFHLKAVGVWQRI